MEPNTADLLRRIEDLEHVAAIKDLKARYWNAVDHQRLDEVRDCYAPDGIALDFEGIPPCQTRDDLIKIIKEQGGRAGFHSAHHGHNPRVRITGPAEAEGLWDMHFSSIDVNERVTIQMTGEYEDRYVLKDGRWWIKATKFRQTTFLMQKIDEKGAPAVVSLAGQNLQAFNK